MCRKRYKSIIKPIVALLFIATHMFLCCSFSYANTYSNNSIEIEVSSGRRSYDYGDNVSIGINITNKNRYAKLHYKVLDVYSGGGFIPLNFDSSEKVIDSLGTIEMEVKLKDYFYKEAGEKTIDTHITFNNGYTTPRHIKSTTSAIGKIKGRKFSYNIGDNVYELTEAEYEEFTRYRNEKVVGGKLGNTLVDKREQEQLEATKSQINATFLIIVIVVIVATILILFIWFIVRSKSRGGYNGMAPFMIFLLIVSLLISNFEFVGIKSYAADIYNENIKYNKTVSTQVSYANFTCTFDVKVEYYFVNTIASITNLELDTDSDTLLDYLEVLYLTDLNNEDTDGDGLPDGVEVYRTYTDPLRVDTDNNGVNDSDEDYDKDKLTNIEEKTYGTDYDNIDTDFDSLSDYDEINGVKSKDDAEIYITDPLSEDTDGDGLRDDTEIKLGLDPTNPRDANTKVNQRSSENAIPRELGKDSPIPISFYGELAGDIDENVKVKLSSNNQYNVMKGIIGNPIEVDTVYSGDDGLKVSFDLTKYAGIKKRIQLCRYVDGELMPVEHTFVSGDRLLCDISSGEYVLVDSKKYTNSLKIYIK